MNSEACFDAKWPGYHDVEKVLYDFVVFMNRSIFEDKDFPSLYFTF